MLTNDSYEVLRERKQQIKHNKRKSFGKNNKKKLINYYFKLNKGYDIDFDNCKTFSEKLQKRRLSKNKLYYICADKVKVRKYVEEKIGSEYLIPELLVTRKFKLKDFDKLPDKFALKTNNASSTNIIVYDKNKENLKSICDKINYFTTIKYGYLFGEYFYNKIPVRIIAEKLLIDNKGNLPDDFKVHCFNNGKRKRKIFESFYTVDGHLMKNLYDEDWNLIDYQYGFASDGRKISKPKKFEEIKKVCDKLSEDFNYVRVDLYIFKNKIYFGELTFTPGAGYAKFIPEKIDMLWGKYMGEEI